MSFHDIKLSEALNTAIKLGDATHGGGGTEELRAFLAALSEKMIYQLALVMYLGRGDFGVDDLVSNYAELKGSMGDSQDAAEQLSNYPSLSNYLRAGLEQLRKQEIDLDRMPLTGVEDFEKAAVYGLRKNAELYRRLADG